ncbi:acyl-CoA dehydrogenase family protein [Streptomyces lunaelactis]|uniref:acyl-CoA dehydrogenase family protein n=1 Tax=Streptomyces lunaelactis TaxID=1535768 RepID=UPI0015849916|nr:acyl-CoA dehydrogenase family protein [Streptomyces lunaelactis]NUK04372.1 acyl-CoA/acyl-ACP dehydrogenase [Streptomyces lunaelactis]
MDFTPTEEQTAARDLAAQIFGDLSTHERLAAAGTGTDAELWKALCSAGLPGAAEDIGLLGLVLLLEEQGRTTAQVPFAATCVYGLLAVAAHGTDEQRARLLPALRDGTAVAAGAFPAHGGVRASAPGRLSGSVPFVPWLRDATHVLVPDAERALWLIRTADAEVTEVETTAPWAAGRLVLSGTPGERLGGPGAYESVLALGRTAFAGLQAGVCAGALARAGEHTATREQFGRPLSTNQGVLLRAADAYMDTEAIRVTAYEAAWRQDEGLDAAAEVLTTAWWASEAGKRVVHAGQHLHGGTGADLDHPVHRHFLWGRQLDAYLGSAPELLAELGKLLAGRPASESVSESVSEPASGSASESVSTSASRSASEPAKESSHESR